MGNNGKHLEELIEFVEKTISPKGLDVKTNSRVFNDEGIQIAEFDITINGKFGSANISWLIECRDRPEQGPAPGSWIEQLVGRRDRFGFNKVTAVSTTGFSTGATDYAKKSGIDLREVKALTPQYFNEWLKINQVLLATRIPTLIGASININHLSDEEKNIFNKEISSKTLNLPILKNPKTGEIFSAQTAFIHAVSLQKSLFDGIEPNKIPKRIQLTVEYYEESLVFETSIGQLKFNEITFIGDLSVKEEFLPIEASEYTENETKEIIAQVASSHFFVEDKKLSLMMHKIAETGETHISLKVDKKN
jgi:hypothetical protein